MYTTKRHTAEISVADYVRDYINIEEFVEYCRECPNHDQRWACPEFDFDVLGYWQSHETLKLIAEEIIFDEEYAGKKYEDEELKEIIRNSMGPVKDKRTAELFEEEKKYPGSVSLSAGSCHLCDKCTRPEGLPCKYPEKLRYSIEALGGNVGMTIEKLMGIHIEWMEENTLPSKFVLVCGLLI